MTINLSLLDISEEDMRREMDLEETMVSAGRTRYEQRAAKERERGNGTASAGGKAVLAHLTVPFAALIVEELARLESGSVRRKPPELRTLRLLPSRDMAVLALRVSLDTLATYTSTRCTTQKMAFAIGTAISAEYVARKFHTEERALFDAVVRKVIQRTSSPTMRTRELVGAFTRTSPEDASDPMNSAEKGRLGACLLGCLESLGVLKSTTTTSKRRSLKTYEIADAALETILKTDTAAAELQPCLLPTIIQPRPWTSIQEGGYWLPFRGNSMVMARVRTNGIRTADDVDMPRMFTPVNYIQATPYRINKKVLEVVTRMRTSNITCSSLPASQLEPIPARPHDIETNEEARKVWRGLARDTYARNAGAKGRILAAEKTISVARDFSDAPEIFFPKVVDFRGRVYDQPMFLKPQGDDLSKGLLEFANGKPLGEDGGYWLAVHGANVWGEDKVSLDDRIQWVMNNETAILEVADSPFGNRMWMDADKPFQFLAFCFEWAGAREEGDAYVSRIAVALDGSCNGLQHLSAMLRDEVGGAAVNLLPAEKPQDIYTEVLNKVVAELRVRAAQGEPTAQKWLPLMKRSVVKRNVMTLPYGATRQGFADQIMEDTLSPLKKAGECPFDTEPYAAAQYLGKIVWDATGEVVIAARAAMDWLQEVAKIVAKAGQPIKWTTPSGFVVNQDYRNTRTREIELLAIGQRMRLRVAEGYEDKIDSRKMALAIAPNFVHAMDAAHMLRTVETLLDVVGPSIHLSMVHDSYGTHAADAERLSYAIRQSFVEMYHEADWLERFRTEIAEQLAPEIAETLPPVPAQGDLEITDVLNSLYFFA
jgi:DNA-directed RNA polymerase, mitochondrial